MTSSFDDNVDAAIAAATAHESELLAVPGVIAVGVGPRRSQGVITGDAAIVVTVAAKQTLDELHAAGQEPLPRELDGIPVDVVELAAPAEAPEIIAAQQAAAAVLDEVREEWLDQPNVTGIGVAYKVTGGRTDYRQVALTIFVERKLAAADVERRSWPMVPPQIGGVQTDVEQLPRLRPSSSASGSRDDRKDPLVGGITVGVNTKPFWYGTLGAIVFDRTSGDQLVLSNQHVLDGPVGTPVVQPSPIGLDDSLEIGFQLDLCNPVHFFRLDTPNTTVGSVLAGAAAACITAAALSDEIDPTRRGQEATVPPAGALTVSERTSVRLKYPELPVPGTHFTVDTSWDYTRSTTAGDLSHSVEEPKRNPHVLADKLLLTDKLRYHPGEVVRLFALVLPEACAPADDDDQPPDLTREEIARLSARSGPPLVRLSEFVATRRSSDGEATIGRRCSCHSFQVTALLAPVSVDRAFPVVLREPVRAQRAALLGALLEALQLRDDRELFARAVRIVRYGCLYAGTLTAVNVPLGGWKHHLYVQTINTATANLKPTQAAQIIGGLPVSQNTTPQLDIACGPAVLEDGQFDIDLI
jgi:hypothetical protein